MARKTFIRKDKHKKKRIPANWRKPKGITNKMRLSRKGHLVKVKPGFGKKKEEKNKHQKTGLKIMQISNKEQLKNANPKTHAIIITKMGKSKKLSLIQEAEKAGFTIINIDTKKYKENVSAFFDQRKKQSKQREQKQQTRKEEEKKAEEKKDKEKSKDAEKEAAQEITQEEKQKQEKEERDKILTKAK